jgi:hypothetical protein
MLSGMRRSLRAFVPRRAPRRGSPGGSDRRRPWRPLSLGLYAAAVMTVPLAASVEGRSPSRAEPAAVVVDAPAAAAPASTDEQRALAGIWWRYEPGLQGEPVRFYYFHGDGTGLYRYGKLGLTNTHSFDYDVVGERLVLDFRKSGEHHEVAFTVRHEPGRDWLELHADPREPGATRYFRDPAALADAGAPPAGDLGPAPAGHMWIDLREHATGGRTFALYQLRAAGIDGRGVGWFHRGDFDDWSTEALTYRIAGDRLALDFTVAGQSEVTRFAVRTDADGTRWLELADDPRDFWHPHRYVDMGPSFGLALAPFER